MSLTQYLKGIGIILLGIFLIVIGYMLAVDAAFKNNDFLGWFSIILIIVGFLPLIIGGYLVKTSYTQPIKIEAEKIKIIICPKCNTENDYDSKFCKKCGNELDMTSQVVTNKTEPILTKTEEPESAEEPDSQFEQAILVGVVVIVIFFLFILFFHK